jgi:isoquinoline 1-oxidoreductase beta subunit
VKRRAWLLGTTAGLGALVVGWTALPQRSRIGIANLMTPGEGDIALNGWIKILPDGSVVLAMPRSEMGRACTRRLPQLAAEELDVPLPACASSRPAGTRVRQRRHAVGNLPFHPAEEEREDGFGRVKAGRWVVGKLGARAGHECTGGSSSVADAWEWCGSRPRPRALRCGRGLPAVEAARGGTAGADGVVTHPSGVRELWRTGARRCATPPGRCS